MLLTCNLRLIIWCILGILAFSASSCRQEEAKPTPPVLSTGFQLTEVTQSNDVRQDVQPFWRAEYYADGSLKTLSDDRDSSYVAYAYAGREIIGTDISPVASWRIPFAEYRLKLNDRHQVTESYRSGTDPLGGRGYDSTTYRYDPAGYLLEQHQRSAYIDKNGMVHHTTRTISTAWNEGDPVAISVTADYHPATGPSTREAFTIKQEYYPDKNDSHNIQTFLRLYGYTWTAQAIPFLKPPRHLLKKVSYLAADGSKIGDWEYTYAAAMVDAPDIITHITITETRGTAVQDTLRYALRYNIR
jgi:hypothetical protein